jgi:hypothetical protein
MKKWTNRELEKLKKLCKNGFSYKQIANKLNRTIGSIIWKSWEENLPKKKFLLVDNLNLNWKGDDVGLISLHEWIINRKPKPEFCERCSQKPPFDLANKSGKYLRDVNDYEWLCRKCHMVDDGRINNLKQFREKQIPQAPKINGSEMYP